MSEKEPAAILVSGLSSFEVVTREDAQHLLRLFPGLGRIPALAPLVGDDDEEADPRALRQSACVALRRVLIGISKKRPLLYLSG